MKKLTRYAHLGVMFTLLVQIGCRPIPESPVPTETVLPASSPTLPLIVTNQITSTGIPALSVVEANSKIQEYLQNGPNCILPCWMGIVPGQATWQELNVQQITLANIATRVTYKFDADSWLLGRLEIHFTNNTATINLNTAFLGPAGTESITFGRFTTQAYKPYDDADRDLYGYGPYNEMLQAYSLPAILSSFGIPDTVHVSASLRRDLPDTPGFGDYFLLQVLYPDRGVFMEYQMRPERHGGNYRICPAAAWINGDLISPDLGTDYGQFLASIDGKYSYLLLPPQQPGIFEEMFGLTNEEFHQRFLSPNDQCLETPISLWWP